MRDLSELIDAQNPAWPLIQEWISRAAVQVEVLETEVATGSAALFYTQVTSRSPMGAVVLNSTAILIDHRWLRILGAGSHPRFLRSLPGWNEGRSKQFYLIADDVIGGFYALNGGAFGVDLGKVYYFAPDTLEWEPCKFGYSEFLIWSMSGKLEDFYAPYRWTDWELEVQPLTGDQVISVYPFLSTQKSPIVDRTRRPIPIEEQYALQFDLKRQLGKSSS